MPKLTNPTKKSRTSKKNKPVKNAFDIENLDDGAIVSEEEDNIYNEDNVEIQLKSEDGESDEELVETLHVQENLEGVDNDDAFGDELEVDDEDKELDDDEVGDVEEDQADEEAEFKETGDDDGCLYKFAKNNKKFDSDDELEDDDMFEVEVNDVNNIIVKAEDRQTKPVLFMYERVRMKGTRARQLSRGAKPMILNVENLTPKEVAELEIQKKVVPFVIVRTLPDGKKEKWHLNELKIVN
jgi:DNA-directed RNA polymerase subunit K/omega